MRSSLGAEGRSARFWWSWFTQDRLRILMYHSIADNPRDPHAVPVARFADQLALLARSGRRVISLPDGISLLHRRARLQGCVVLTFDDAYADFVTNALPLLERHGCPATLFVPTGLLGRTSLWDSYDRAKPLLDWDGVAEAMRRGVTIASHTVSHARLTECDAAGLDNELRGSLDCLCANLGEVYPALSYPGGHYGPREREAARRAGYNCALGVASRWGNGPETDLLALRREGPGSR